MSSNLKQDQLIEILGKMKKSQVGQKTCDYNI